MLRHEPNEETEPSLPSWQAHDASAEAAPAIRHDPAIEAYLERVFSRQLGALPNDERQVRINAVRAHIEQSVAAHVEIGASRDEALSLTLAQVQRENAVAVHAVTPVLKSRLRSQPSARQATAIATGVFGLFYLLDQTRLAGHLWNRMFGGLYDEAGEVMRNSAAVAGFYRFELFVLPILCGLLVGLLAKQRPARGTLNALALLAIPAILWGGIAYGLQFAELLPGQTPGWMSWVFPNPLPAVAGIGFWALLGGLSAGAGGWLRRRLPHIVKGARLAGSRIRRRVQRPRRPWHRRDVQPVTTLPRP